MFAVLGTARCVTKPSSGDRAGGGEDGVFYSGLPRSGLFEL